MTLELGGNDPAIVLPDVDPAEAAPAIFQGAMKNTGQVRGHSVLRSFWAALALLAVGGFCAAAL